MPKLTKAVAKQVNDADAASGFEPYPEGRYAAQLRSVTQKEGKEYPYWSWEFHNIHDTSGKLMPGRMWNNTSLSPNSVGFLKSTFEAFGYTADSDTDEMIGEWVVLYITQEVISSGPKAGQFSNSVRSLTEFNPDDWDVDTEKYAASGTY